MNYKKKLIEVALPLEAINKESAREKSIRHGHPSTLHLWWARRPLAACRAVLFASLVDDPSSHPDEFPTEIEQEDERNRLFGIIERLVKWENINNDIVLAEARQEILKSTNGNPPPVLDPFCGGGSIPLEAQRLGLEAHGSDLNPVAVLITKALIEIPPKFANRPPVHPIENKQLLQRNWQGAQGLAEDIRYYGQWMRDEAQKRIGHLYPKVKVTEEMLRERPELKQQGLKPEDELTVIAWLWARTVKCPNPACGAQMPLISSFWLSNKKDKEVWLEPQINHSEKVVNFLVKKGPGNPPVPPKIGRGAKFKCLVCGEISQNDHIKSEGMSGRMNAQLMAIVAEGKKGRIYFSPIKSHEESAKVAEPTFRPKEELANDPRNIWCISYGLKTFDKLFTDRQLFALNTFSDLVLEAREKIIQNAGNADLPLDKKCLNEGGIGAVAYADALVTYLAFLIDKQADLGNALNRWEPIAQCPRQLFGRQAIPMIWDFAEGNPLGNKSGSWVILIDNLIHSLSSEGFNFNRKSFGIAFQLDATDAINQVIHPLISTDPPYYDNIGYADLSDFFYIWLRRSLKHIYPNLFSTLMVPKKQELVATPFRFDGDKEKAKQFFEKGAVTAFSLMRQVHHNDVPMTVYYAFKQTENDEDDKEGKAMMSVSTGWETMLEGLIKSGFIVTATWPMRTECTGRTNALGTNALASSIVIVCRPRPETAPMATRREFISTLKAELPQALRNLQQGNIAPVDLAQAVIGPGMAVFSRFAKVIEADGTPLSVRTALQIINQQLDEFLNEQEGEMDQDTRFCISWFDQYGHTPGPFGEADVLARAKNTSVQGLVEAGVIESRSGKVRLLNRDEYPYQWDPTKDKRLTVWECTQQLILHFNKGTEQGAATIAARLGSGRSEEARALAYRLYTICERKNRAKEALDYNSLVIAWPEISKLANEPHRQEQQKSLFK